MRISDWSSDVCSSDLAMEKLALVEKEKDNKGTHDLGFMLYCSFGNAYRLMGDTSFRSVLLTGAESLISDRKSVVSGKRVSVSVVLGGRRIIKKKYYITNIQTLLRV